MADAALSRQGLTLLISGSIVEVAQDGITAEGIGVFLLAKAVGRGAVCAPRGRRQVSVGQESAADAVYAPVPKEVNAKAKGNKGVGALEEASQRVVVRCVF